MIFTDVLTRLLKRVLKFFGLRIIRWDTMDKVINTERARAKAKIEFIQKMPSASQEILLQYFGHSRSQIHQDLFVIQGLNFKRNGFFVEYWCNKWD